MNSFLQYARIPNVERSKGSLESQETSELLNLIERGRKSMSSNAAIWERLAEELISRMDGYLSVPVSEGYRFVHPNKDPNFDYINLYPLDLRAALSIASDKYVTLIALS